jgi:opacity protein-like surface antigen
VVPYIGGGLGGAHAEGASGTGIDNFGRTVHLAGGSAVRGVALVEGGLNVALGDHFVLVPAYRWTRYFGGGGLGETEAAHIVKIGLRYTF